MPTKETTTRLLKERYFHTGAMAIGALVLLSAMLDLADPGNGVYRKAFLILLGILFLYVRLALLVSRRRRPHS